MDAANQLAPVTNGGDSAAPLLALQGVNKRFGQLQALDDVTLDVAPGEIHCLLGENGAGKSTLCNLIFGVYQPDGGQMMWQGQPHRPTGPASALADGIAMVHQHFSLVPDMTVVDNLLLGQSSGVLRRKEAARRVSQLAQTYGLATDPYARVQDLSVGERQRVEIIKCLMRDPKLVVLDEPTAVLLPAEIDDLLAVCVRMVSKGCSVVLVTHKLAEIRKIAHRVTVLRGGRVVARSSNPSADMDDLVRAMIQRDLIGLRARPDECAGAKKEPSPSEQGIQAGLGSGPAWSTPARRFTLSDEALQVDGLSVRDTENVIRLNKVTLVVNRGEIVGVAGVEGNGQSELAEVLSGMTRASEGRFHVCGRDMTDQTPNALTEAGVGVIPEDRHAVACVTEMSVAENMMLNCLGRFSRFGLIDRAALSQAATELMTGFDVRAASPHVPFSSLSGGNQQKAVLAREISTRGLAFLLAAQPTRGLDVGAVESIYRQIRATCERGVGVLLISSELDELLNVAHRIVVFYRGQVVGECKAEPQARERIGAMMAGQAI